MAGSKPEGMAGVLPHLSVKNGAAALDFYVRAFNAVIEYQMPADDGKRVLYARLTVNGGVLMLSDDFPEYAGGASQIPAPGAPRGVVLHLQVADVDAAYAQAVAAGADPTMPPEDMFWGDRYGQLRDPFGHIWSLAHTIGAGGKPG